MSLNACSSGLKSITWREEVKLTNGQVIILEHEVDYLKMFNGNSMGYQFQHEHLHAVLPPANKEIVWDGNLQSLALDLARNGDLYLVTTAETSQAQVEYSLPRWGHHVAFKYNGSGQWTRIPIESVPHEIRPNLLIDSGREFLDLDRPTNVLIDLATKEKLNANQLIGEMYRSWPTK